MEYVNERKGRCVRPVLGSSLWIISFLAAGFLENQTFSNEVFTNAIARVPQRNPRYASFPARPLPRALLRTTLSVTPLRDLSRASPHDPRCAHSLIRPPERENSAREKNPPIFGNSARRYAARRAVACVCRRDPTFLRNISGEFVA